MLVRSNGNSTSVNVQITNTGLTLGRLATCTAGLKSNIIDTYTDTDLIFRRNGVEYFRLDDLTGTEKLNVANDKGSIPQHPMYLETDFGIEVLYQTLHFSVLV